MSTKMKTKLGWIVKLSSRKGEPVDTRGPFKTRIAAETRAKDLVGTKILRLKVARYVVERRRTVLFSEMKRAAVVLDDEALSGLFEVGGRRQRWVGFAFVDEGPAKGTEPVVVDG